MRESNALEIEALKRWRNGDSAAAEHLYQRYVRELVRLADQHLSRKVARRADGEDVVQSVFRTFFRRSAAGEFTIDNGNQLWRLLVTITIRKARAVARFHAADRRDVGSELEETPDGLPAPELVARDPDPAEAAAVVEEIEALLQGLPAVHALVLEQRLQGRSAVGIAQSVGLARQSVYRILKVLHHRLELRSMVVREIRETE